MFEDKQVVHHEVFALHAGHFGNLDHLTGPAQEPAHLHHYVNGRGNLPANHPDRQIEPRHADHDLQPAQRLARVVGVNRGEAAIVAGVHGLEHVQRLGATAFPDDNPVRPHPQRVAYQVARGDFSESLGVIRPRLQAADVGLLQTELGGVLNRDDALFGRNERRQRIEQGGLAAAGAAGNQNVHAGAHAGGQEIHHFQGNGFLGHQVCGQDRMHAKAPNRNQGAIQGQRRNNRIDAAAVGQSAIDHGAGLIDAPPGLADDPLNNVQQVPRISKRYGSPLQLPRPFHIDRVVTVYEDVGNGRIFHQGLERAQAKGFVQHLVDEPLALGAAQQAGAALAEFLGDAADLLLQLVLVHGADRGQVHGHDQLMMELCL